MSSNYNHEWHKALAFHIQIEFPKSDKAIMAEMAQARQTRPSLIFPLKPVNKQFAYL